MRFMVKGSRDKRSA